MRGEDFILPFFVNPGNTFEKGRMLREKLFFDSLMYFKLMIDGIF
jgi:hypothetical protein